MLISVRVRCLSLTALLLIGSGPVHAERIFVGNLPWSVGDAELSGLFEPHGTVHWAVVATEAGTGRSRGFGYVEMDCVAAVNVIHAMDGYSLDGRVLRVQLAEEAECGRVGSETDRY